MDNSAGVGPGSLSPPGPDADGRVGGVFCQLHAARFSGEVYVESGVNQLTLVFFGGNPVFAEDVSGGGSLSTLFVERGLITQTSFGELAAGDFDTIGSCIDMGLCARAVETGRVSATEATSIAMQWVRTHVMSAMKWTDCYVDLDDTVVAPPSLHAWAQPLGPLIYLGVRTFYGPDAIDAVFADDKHSTVEFVAPVEAMVDFFGLEQEEGWLLEACAPSMPVQEILQLSELDELHTWQLLVLLRLAGLVDLSAFSEMATPDADPSGVHARVGPSPTASAPPASPAVTRPPTTGGYRESSPSGGGERTVAPKRAVPARAPSRSQPVETRKARTAPAKRAPRQEAVARLNKELGRRRPPGAATSRAPAPRPSTAAAPARAPSRPGGDAFLKDLVRRRMAHSGGSRPASEGLDAVASFSRGQAELRKQAFDKAEGHFLKAVTGEPENELYQAHHLWAQLRTAARLDEERKTTLRGLLRQFVSSEDHKAFALHALGYLAFAEGHDDKAEKFLRKALEANRRNKDAERYLRIVERRRAGTAGEPQKIFGIELSTRMGKK